MSPNARGARRSSRRRGAAAAPLGSPFPSSFPLAAPVAFTDDGGLHGGLTVGQLFTVLTSGRTATGARFYAEAAADALPVTGYLFSTAGAVLASSSAINKEPGAYVSLPFTTPFALSSGTNYYIGVFTPATSGEQYSVGNPPWPKANANISIGTLGGFFNYDTTPGFSTAGSPSKGTSAGWFGVDLVYT